MASFTNQIGYLTGDKNKNQASVIVEALKNGVKETIVKVSQINPNMLHSMSSTVAVTANDDNDNKIEENNLVLHVNRYDSTNSLRRDCMPIDKKNILKAVDTGSIYYAPKTSPVYSIDNGRILIYPEPTATENSEVTKVVAGTINDSNGTISEMPENLYIQVVRFAARECLLERLGDFTTKLPTDLDADTTMFDMIADFDDSIGVTTTLPSIHADYQDAVDKAQHLIDDVSQIGGDVNVDGSGTDIYSAQKWLVDEDPEMLGGTLSTAAQELQRASAVLAGHSAEINKYQAEISKESQEAGQALQEYQANLQKKIQLFSTIISKITTDYQWLQGQIAMITQQLEQGWSMIAVPDFDSQAKLLGGGIAK
jgi:hypothetical protein